MAGFKRFWLASAIMVLGSAVIAPAADLTLKMSEKPVPVEIGETIRAVLQPSAIQLLDGDKPAYEVWLRAELPLKSKPAPAPDSLGAIAETTLVGVIAVNGDNFKDYKDNPIPKGIYTARFAMQPQDGNHAGTADYLSFLVLVAASDDKDLGGITKFTPLIKTSGKLTPSGHPIIVNLRPVAVADVASLAITEPVAEHKALRLKVPGKAGDGGEKAEVAFDLVFRGKGHVE